MRWTVLTPILALPLLVAAQEPAGAQAPLRITPQAHPAPAATTAKKPVRARSVKRPRSKTHPA
ncbi:MAG: hypothetical protein J0H62_06505, partial [Rhizobiales bacterium]|nr:hypothetical protein [Hyphomicrobiales bacterium]